MPENKKSLAEKLADASPYISAVMALFSAIAAAVGEPVDVVAARVAAHAAKVARGEAADGTDPLLAELEKDLGNGD
jgi:hypothetical protein